MVDPFLSVNFVAASKTRSELQSLNRLAGATRGMRGRDASVTKQFGSDEEAARFYLSRIFEGDARPAVRGLTAPQSPEVVPDMKLQRADDLKGTKTKLLRFEQTHHDVPIFGGSAVVELDQKRELVGVRADVVQVGNVSPHPSISQAVALESIAKLTGTESHDIRPDRPATLVYYHDDRVGLWHLAFFFAEVLAAPANFLGDATDRHSSGHGLGPSPREDRPLLNYIVDAHNATVLKYYSAAPMITKAKGLDVLGVSRPFYVERNGANFELWDTQKHVKTYDLQLTDLGKVPSDPVRHIESDFAGINPAAVSAHCNAVLVLKQAALIGFFVSCASAYLERAEVVGVGFGGVVVSGAGLFGSQNR